MANGNLYKLRVFTFLAEIGAVRTIVAHRRTHIHTDGHTYTQTDTHTHRRTHIHTDGHTYTQTDTHAQYTQANGYNHMRYLADFFKSALYA